MVRRWITWWRQGDAQPRWSGEAPLADRIAWRAGAAGVEWGELQLRGASEAWRTRVVVARLDPRHIDLSLAPAFIGGRMWTVGDADSSAALALDAGQFRHVAPLGLGSDRREGSARARSTPRSPVRSWSTATAR